MADLDDDNFCPLCMELLDDAEQDFYPCECDYQVCAWCFKQLREDHNNSCPACRTPYDEAKFRNVRRARPEKPAPTGKPKDVDAIRAAKRPAATHHDLRNVRVIQRNLVYVVGIPCYLAKREILRQEQYFGQYGAILNVVINKPSSPGMTTCSVYITFARKEAARAAIVDIDGAVFEGRQLRAAYGTTKYCGFFIRGAKCTNQDCFYLHQLGDEEDRCYTKEDIVSAKPLPENEQHESNFGKPPVRTPPSREQPRKPQPVTQQTWAKLTRPVEPSNDSNFPSLSVVASPKAAKKKADPPCSPLPSSSVSESLLQQKNITVTIGKKQRKKKVDLKNEVGAPVLGSRPQEKTEIDVPETPPPGSTITSRPTVPPSTAGAGMELPQFFDLQWPAPPGGSDPSSGPPPVRRSSRLVPPLHSVFGKPGAFEMTGQSIRTNGSFLPERVPNDADEQGDTHNRMAAWFMLLKAVRSDQEEVTNSSIIAGNRRSPDGQPVLAKLVNDLKNGMPLDSTLKSTQVINNFGGLLKMQLGGVNKDDFSSAVPLASGETLVVL